MKTNRYSQNPPMFRNNPFSFIITILLIFAFGLGILIFPNGQVGFSIGNVQFSFEKF